MDINAHENMSTNGSMSYPTIFPPRPDSYMLPQGLDVSDALVGKVLLEVNGAEIRQPKARSNWSESQYGCVCSTEALGWSNIAGWRLVVISSNLLSCAPLAGVQRERQ